jgi:hypothetical protein
MNDARAHVALLVDYANLRQGAMSDDGPGDGSAVGAGEASSFPTPTEVARALFSYAEGMGRVSLARAYADWSREPDLARELSTSRLVPVLVPATQDGEDRSHIRLVVDAMEVLFNGDEPDAFVIASGDPSLVPLVQALRADGSEVVVVAYEAAIAPEMRSEADRFASFEDVLGGARAEPLQPRFPREERTETRREPSRAGANGRPRQGDEARPRREYARWTGPLLTVPEFADYDWTRFVRLIDELEERLPFVGVRYLVNKVLAPHNCGIDDPRIKRDLINEAVDQGLIEMYTVGNVNERTDPVTACRLDRQSTLVAAILRARDDEEAEDDEDDEGDGTRENGAHAAAEEPVGEAVARED